MNSYIDILEQFLITVAIKASIITVLVLGITLPLIISTSLVYYLVEIFGAIL